MSADIFWIMSHSKKHVQMVQEFIEVVRVDLEPTASMWVSEVNEDRSWVPHKVVINSHWKKNSRHWDVVNRQGKTCGVVEERIQWANKVFWTDITEVRTSRGDQNVKDWWITCTLSFFLNMDNHYGARSTWANFDLGHRLFLLGPDLLWPGATQASPKIRGFSSISARCKIGQFWLAPLTIQNVKKKKQ